jgi:hypothetical protein
VVNNTAVGLVALFNNADGNTAVGAAPLGTIPPCWQYSRYAGARRQHHRQQHSHSDHAGFNQTTGSSNVYIGSNILGTPGESNTCYIASTFGQTSSSGIPVLINSDNKLGTTTSSKRFKEDIKPMGKTSETLFALNPITFRYKKEIDQQAPRNWACGERGKDIGLVVLDKEETLRCSTTSERDVSTSFSKSIAKWKSYQHCRKHQQQQLMRYRVCRR